MRKIHLLILLLLACLTLQAGADEPKPTTFRVYILAPSNQATLPTALQGGYQAIYLQVHAATITPAEVDTLMQWVQQGGSLWFSDSRMAQDFGMQQAPMPGDALTGGSVEQWPYAGIKKFKVGAALVYAVGDDNPIVHDLEFDRAFLLPLDRGMYSAVKAGGDVVGLLRGTIDPMDRNSDKMLAAYRLVGKGTIVFKPLVDDGHFEDNLRQWLVDRPPTDVAVAATSPNAASATASPATPTAAAAPAGVDTLVTSRGETVHGHILNVSLTTVAVTVTTWPIADLRCLVTDIGNGYDLIVGRDGQRVQTRVQFGDHGITLRTTDGQTRQFDRGDIVMVEFASR